MASLPLKTLSIINFFKTKILFHSLQNNQETNMQTNKQKDKEHENKSSHTGTTSFSVLVSIFP